MRRTVAIVIALLSWPNDARPSKEYDRAISLADLVSRSDAILVVRAAKPFETFQRLGPRPQFVRQTWRFNVVRQLKGTRFWGRSKQVSILPADWERWYEIHRRSLRGRTTSTERVVYESAITDAQLAHDEFIIFVSPAEKGWEFSVDGAWESGSREGDVLAAMRPPA